MQTEQSKPVLTLESVRRVPLDSGGYAKDGTYYGHGKPIYMVTLDNGNGYPVRAHDRDDAASQLLTDVLPWGKEVQTVTVNGTEYPARHNVLPWQQKGLQQTRSGYGRRLTTTREVYYGGKWRRVYCCIFSNSGTCYLGKNMQEGLIVRD